MEILINLISCLLCFGSIRSGVIYRLLNKNILEDYVYLTISGRVYLILETPNLPTLAEKIAADIQYKRKNIIKKRS